MKRVIYHLILGLCLLVPIQMNAQTVENNFQQRISSSLNFKVDKNVSLFLQPEIRTEENTMSFNDVLMEGGISYDLNKWIELSGLYRFQRKSAKSFQRFGIASSFSKKLGLFNASLRLMYTLEDQFNKNDKLDKILRTRLKFKFKKIKYFITPIAGIEFFRNMDQNEWEKNRYIFGVTRKINSKLKITFQYKFDYFISKFQNDHIVGLKFNVDLLGG